MIGEAAANIVLNIVLCRVMGVFGIVLATVLSVSVTNLLLCPQVLFSHYFKNGKLKQYWADHISYALTMIMTAGASWLTCNLTLPMSMSLTRGWTGFVCLAGRLAICFIMSIAVFWIIWHGSERYKQVLNWMKRLAKA